MEKSLRAVGFTKDEIENMADHRAMRIAWKASEYDRLRTKAKGVREKKLLKLPKGPIRRAARDEGGPKREATAKRKALVAAARGGDEEAAMALIAEHLDD